MQDRDADLIRYNNHYNCINVAKNLVICAMGEKMLKTHFAVFMDVWVPDRWREVHRRWRVRVVAREVENAAEAAVLVQRVARTAVGRGWGG